MRRRQGEDGFTLIEMLVALAVFSIAALALLRLDALSVRTGGELRDRSMARLVAQNEAALIASAPLAPAEGTDAKTVTNHGQSFTVLSDVRPMPGSDRMAVVLVVRPENGRSDARLTLVRPKDRR